MIKVEQTTTGERVARDSAAAAVGALVGAIVGKAAGAGVSSALLGAGALAGIAVTEAVAGVKEKEAITQQQTAKTVPQDKKPAGLATSTPPPPPIRYTAEMPTGQAAPLTAGGALLHPVQAGDWLPGGQYHPLKLLGVPLLDQEHAGWLFALLTHGLSCMKAYESDLLHTAQMAWNYRPMRGVNDPRLISQSDWEMRRLSTYRMECPPPTAEDWGQNGQGYGERDGYIFGSWWRAINRNNVGKRIAGFVKGTRAPTDAELQENGWENFGLKNAYSSVPWDNWKGTVPARPGWWVGGDNLFYTRLQDYYRNAQWLVWAGEMWRLHAIVYPKRIPALEKTGARPTITSACFASGEAPLWWKVHCRAWGVGCANATRMGSRGSWRGYPYTTTQYSHYNTYKHLHEPPFTPSVIAKGFGGSIEQMLRMVMSATPPPGSLPTGFELANTLKGEFRRIPDWPGALGEMRPGHQLPPSVYEYIQRMLLKEQAYKPSTAEGVCLGVLMAVFEIVVTVVSDGVASAPVAFAMGAVAQLARLGERYMGTFSETGRTGARLGDLISFAFKIIENVDLGPALARVLKVADLPLDMVKGQYLDVLARMHGQAVTWYEKVKGSGIGIATILPNNAKILWPYGAEMFDNIVADVSASRPDIQKKLEAGLDQSLNWDDYS